MKYKLYKKGDIIFNYGDIGDLFYIITSGKVGVHVPSDTIYNSKLDDQFQNEFVIVKEGKYSIKKYALLFYQTFLLK